MGWRERISFIMVLYISLKENGATEYGMRERISFILVFYISLIENGGTEFGMEGKILPPDIFVCFSYRKWRD